VTLVPSGRPRALSLAVVVVGTVCGLAMAQATQVPQEPVAPAKAWPDAEELRQRREAAETLPLFAVADPLTVTLSADFKAINKDRTVDNASRFPGVLTVASPGAAPVTVPVQLGTRGHLRLNRGTCSFVPLKVEFSKKDVKGTVFAGQGSLKLVTHCQNFGEYDQYVLAEALAYRIGNVLTSQSFRTRLARTTYVDVATGKPAATRWSFFVEDQDDVARRMEGRIAPLEKLLFRNLDRPSLLRVMVLETLVGNTDFSIHALHNIRLVQDAAGVVRPLAYDFDVSGLVNPPYAVPDRRLHLSSVRQRLYRGPCLTPAELEPTLAEFRARRSEILALCDAEAGFTDATRAAVKDYLAEFFDIIASPGRTKFLFIDRCHDAPGV
jgi:hypothetical protein